MRHHQNQQVEVYQRKSWEIRDSQFDFKEIARADRLCNFAAVVYELILYSVCIQFALAKVDVVKLPDC